jgi:hypothetical protein
MPSKYLKDPRMLLKARSVLLAAYDLLSDRSRWTQGTVARDEFDRQVPVTDPSAEKWCAVGAIDRACQEMDVPFMRRETLVSLANELMMRDLKRVEGTDSIPSVNDRPDPETAYEKIMASFNRLLDLRHVQRLSRRSEAAMKGWATRRARVTAEVAARRAEWEARRAAQPTMTFGGTLPTTDASTERKDSPICATSRV